MGTQRLVVGISGASCAQLGIMLLHLVRRLPEWETHLVISRGGELTIAHETGHSLADIRALATCWYDETALGAAIASGSFMTAGMVIVPCSVKTLAAIACGYSETLMARAADVTLKERRRLVLAVRESPLSAVHLHNMLTVTQAGAMVVPPVIGMYHKPQTVEDVLRHSLSTLLRPFGIQVPGVGEWQGA